MRSLMMIEGAQSGLTQNEFKYWKLLELPSNVIKYIFFFCNS